MSKDFRTPWWLLPLEGRALAEFSTAYLRRGHSGMERGDGHRVIVIPGFLADDFAVRPLVQALVRTGYRAQSWGLARNTGMTRERGEQLQSLVNTCCSEDGDTLSLIGWSLGGIFARELARRMPDSIRQVITLGSPIQDSAHTTIAPLYRLFRPGAERTVDPRQQARLAEPPPVPCSAIYTRSDGVVPWEASLEPERPHTRNIEVRGSHFGLPANVEVWRECARLLAHPKARPKATTTRRKQTTH